MYHFYGSLTEGVSFSLDLFVIKGSIALKLEPFQGRKWFTAVIDVVPIVGGEIHETFHIFPIPFTSAGAGVEVNGFVAGSTVSAADLNKQWLEQLHLFSKLALANGGALPVPSEVSVVSLVLLTSHTTATDVSLHYRLPKQTPSLSGIDK